MIEARSLGLPVVYCSEHEVVCIKPAGMASELTSDPKGVSLLGRIRRVAGGQGARLPHRLDRVTRGLIVCAFSEESASHHGACIRAGVWEKYYLARVAAGPDQAGELVGEHRAYLKQRGMRAEIVRSGGKPSQLTVLACAGAPGRREESHFVVKLETGRFHQIRAILAGIGAPLVGDALYGGPRGPFYLEHALLRFVPFGSERIHTVFVEDDPDREPIRGDIISVLSRLVRPA